METIYSEMAPHAQAVFHLKTKGAVKIRHLLVARPDLQIDFLATPFLKGLDRGFDQLGPDPTPTLLRGDSYPVKPAPVAVITSLAGTDDPAVTLGNEYQVIHCQLFLDHPGRFVVRGGVWKDLFPEGDQGLFVLGLEFSDDHIVYIGSGSIMEVNCDRCSAIRTLILPLTRFLAQPVLSIENLFWNGFRKSERVFPG